MFIAFIIILILGFINSSFWYLFIFLAFYFFITMNSRSRKAVEKRIMMMLMTGTSEKQFPELFFEACEAYAKSHNGNDSHDRSDSASCNLFFQGREYRVFFMKIDKSLGGGTYISISDYQNEIQKHLDELKKFSK